MSAAPRPKGLDIGDAAMFRLDPAMAPAEQEHGWTLAQAEEQINHLTGTKAEMLQAIAYLACQVHGYKKASNLDATLAIAQVENIVKNYRARK
ncbi:hypothetical protein [Paenarthrobacter sp. YJN-5]|uniref:hypothetical protein n=1 Tax=Paenarthrobacter sp. YJN-5 TaxID=2735316 RepID=UPI00187807B7|nr:hypothetical protein [Paenarthrobacter sp. YJN-5]QOT15901.1 hypothetical protein HMI59_04385 [Paenarthrobacter sp. YJN-5]